MSSATSLVFYVISFLLSVVFIYLGNRVNATRIKLSFGRRHLSVSPLVSVGVMIPILVAGFRQGVGTDFGSYASEYNLAIQSGSYLEFSFNLIAKLSHALFGTPTFMFIIFSALTVVPVILAVNRSTVIRREYRWVFWILFLFIMFPQTLNMLRQGVSVAIGFYLIVSIIESRKLIRFSHLVYLLLAISFHVSAWLLVPMCFMANSLNNKRKTSLVIFILIFSTAAIIGFSALPQILGRLGGEWSGYLDQNILSRSVVPRSLLILSILMVCWKFYNALKISNSYIALLWAGLFLSVEGLFVAYFERAGYYVTLLFPLLGLVLIAQAVPRRQTIVINSILCLFATAYFVGVYYLMGSSGIFPYNWSMR